MQNVHEIQSGLVEEPTVIGNEKQAAAPSLGLQKAAIGGKLDELQHYLFNHWTATDTFPWSASNLPGTKLYTSKIWPNSTFPIFKYITKVYNTWGGHINYRASLVGNAFVGGKLAMTWLPPNLNPDDFRTAQDLTVFPYVVCDAKETDTIDLQTGDQNALKYHLFPRTVADESNPDYFGGWFIIFVLNQLVAAPNTNAITVQLYVNCHDMHLGQIIPPVIQQNTDLPIVRYNDKTVCGLGDSYSGVVIFEKAAMPSAVKFTDGVLKGDGNYYNAPGFVIGKNLTTHNITAENTIAIDRSTSMFPNMYAKLKTPLQIGEHVASQLKFFNATHLDSVNQQIPHFNGTSVPTGNIGYIPTPNFTFSANGYGFFESAISQNATHPFFPAGASGESFLALLGTLPFVPAEVPPLVNPFYYQDNTRVLTPKTEGYAFFGQAFDAETGNPLFYFKTYYEGFMTSSATLTTKVIQRPLVFQALSLVNAEYPLPQGTAAMNVTLHTEVDVKRYTKKFQRFHKQSCQELSMALSTLDQTH
jgi:hypothetical protein